MISTNSANLYLREPDVTAWPGTKVKSPVRTCLHREASH